MHDTARFAAGLDFLMPVAAVTQAGFVEKGKTAVKRKDGLLELSKAEIARS
jgi:hypothetical protein